MEKNIMQMISPAAETQVQKSRKRKRWPETWKRNIAKKARHRPKGFPVMPSCGHGTKGSFQCHQLSMQGIRRIHQKYNINADLESKKNYTLQHVAASSAKIIRLPEGQSRRQVHFIHYPGKDNALLNIIDAPYTDNGSTCMNLENKINDEWDKTVKHNLQIELLAHKKRADTFYQQLREKSDKYGYAKGSNQRASSLHHRLNKLNLDEVTTLRLFSDGCEAKIKIPDVVRGVRMNDAKINDVRTLLTLHFGEKWEEKTKLTFNTQVFQQQTAVNVPATARNDNDDDDDEEMDGFEFMYDEVNEIC
ncbi:hypothetical protein PR048_021054 [Dryococelus australis]|uniref:Uncharacterized protein n=1 Tax=Dryococelus australis TaxID=614101 RepID=A0ABQ9GX56_9NEOP|nr:hypothetical protein PR048_021054 [Dryococelus australis]